MLRLLRHQLPGFTLLEVAIVLCIISILSGLGLPLLNQYIKQKRFHITEDHLEKVIHALSTFVITHKRLPCPADPSASSNMQGIEQESCLYKKVFRGIVPYRSLGLPEKIAKDGYHNWLTYAVNLDLTSLELRHLNITDDTTPLTAAFCEVKKSDNALDVRNQDNLPVIDSPSNIIAFVLISHGKSGQGSLDLRGKVSPATNHSKLINATAGQMFIDKPLSFSKEDFFDDIVRWITRDNLMAFYGKNPCYREKTDS